MPLTSTPSAVAALAPHPIAAPVHISMLVYPSPSPMQHAAMLARHAAWWVLPVALALAILLRVVCYLAKRRDLTCAMPSRRTLLIAGVIAGGIGVVAQGFYALLTSAVGVSSGWSRLAALALGGLLTGILSARIVPFLEPRRAALYGMLAALPMGSTYAYYILRGTLSSADPVLSAISPDSMARVLLGIILGAFIALAIRFPMGPPPDISALTPPNGQRHPLRRTVASGAITISEESMTVFPDHPRIG